MVARKKRLAGQIGDADFILKQITGKGITDYGKMLWQLWGKDVTEAAVSNAQDIDEEDRKDCRLFGADSFYAYPVFKFAVKLFREKHHPDRFLLAGDKAREEKIFKQGGQAISRICERREWKVP